MQVPQTSHGSKYTCDAKGCTAATTDDPTAANAAGTAQITLPEECGGAFHEIVILNAHSKSPQVLVTCAPKEDPVGEM